MKYFIFFLLSMHSLMGFTQSIEGYWETYNDASGELESEVKIFIKDGKLYGKIIKLYNSDGDTDHSKCHLCTDYRKDQPIIGMIFMSGLKLSGNEWTGTKVLLDPNSGKKYDGKVWLVNNNKLAVRGYLGWFFRTQYWKRKP